MCEIFSRGQAFLAQGTDHFLNKMLSIRKVRLLITSRYIAMKSYECVIITKMFLIYFISYGCNGGALVFLRGAEVSASPSFALPMFITIKKIIILHLFLGVPAATLGGTGTPWHTRGYAPDLKWSILRACCCCCWQGARFPKSKVAVEFSGTYDAFGKLITGSLLVCSVYFLGLWDCFIGLKIMIIIN